MNQIKPTHPDPRPPLILIIPDTRLAQEPALAASINGCEAAYHRGRWYVTVPAEMWVRMPQEAQVQA